MDGCVLGLLNAVTILGKSFDLAILSETISKVFTVF